MNKLWTLVTIIILLLIFIGYMVFDLVLRKEDVQTVTADKSDSLIPDHWVVDKVIDVERGKLKCVTVSKDGNIILGGENYIRYYNPGFVLKWETETEPAITAVAVFSDKLYAAVNNSVNVFNLKGEKVSEWGPYEEKSIITSLSVNDKYIAFADAAQKTVFILDTGGEVKHIIGRSDEPFIVPSPYFDVALGSDNTLFIANTGKLRIEHRTIDGTLIDYYGEAGLAPEAFCGCCNPAHFALMPEGFVTAEKGVNRIKILDSKGEFVEFVSSLNDFLPPIPLDIAVSADGNTIFGANPADSKLYSFKRKNR